MDGWKGGTINELREMEGRNEGWMDEGKERWKKGSVDGRKGGRREERKD